MPIGLLATARDATQSYVYGHDIAVSATLIFFVAGPAVAAAASWEASRFREFLGDHSRSAVRVIFDRIVPLSATLPIAYLLAVFIRGPRASVVGEAVLWYLLLYSLLVGLCWALIGAALGLSLRPIVAVPLSGILPYAWYAVMPATQPGPLRRVTGDMLSCCSIDSALDPRAILVAAGGIVGLCALVIGIAFFLGRYAVSGAVAAVLACVCLGGSLIGAGRIDAFGIIDRDRGDIICRGEICAWPEVPDENIRMNAEALRAFRSIAPQGWRHLADGPVAWDGPFQERLIFSGQRTVEGVLGSFVDQAGSAELMSAHARLCGSPIEDIGPIRTQLPWEPGAPIDMAVIHQRLEGAVCPPHVAPR